MVLEDGHKGCVQASKHLTKAAAAIAAAMSEMAQRFATTGTGPVRLCFDYVTLSTLAVRHHVLCGADSLGGATIDDRRLEPRLNLCRGMT